MCGTKSELITTYHSATNDKIERLNGTTEDMLRLYLGKRQQSWDKCLYLIQFAYNQGEYSNISTSPFYALYDQKCRIPITLVTFNSKIESLNQMIQKCIIYLNVLSNVCKVRKRDPNSMPIKKGVYESLRLVKRYF